MFRSWVASLALALTAAGCAAPGTAGGGDRPLVVAAFYPLERLAAEVAGDRAEVVAVTPPGVEPHDVELTARQVVAITEADLLLYLGRGFQPAIEELASSVEGDVLDVLEVVELLEGGPDDHGDEDEDGDHGDEMGADPHVWLDPVRMAGIARAVGDRLAAVDPDGADAYRSAADDLSARFDALHHELETGLADCERRVVVTAHDAFGYLAARYELETEGIVGIDPESEPSPQRLAEISRFVRSHGVTTIFFETLLPSGVAETVARETGAVTDVLDPLESQPERGNYFTAMRANLDALRKALGCR